MKGARAGPSLTPLGSQPCVDTAGTSCAGIVGGAATGQQQDGDGSAHPIPGWAVQGVAGLRCVNKGPIQGSCVAALGSAVPAPHAQELGHPFSCLHPSGNGTVVVPL